MKYCLVIWQEGFRYHHAELNYLMLVRWLPETPDTIPANASHRVGVGAFVLNDKREVTFYLATVPLLTFALLRLSNRKMRKDRNVTLDLLIQLFLEGWSRTVHFSLQQ